jgi:hypothetical protein
MILQMNGTKNSGSMRIVKYIIIKGKEQAMCLYNWAQLSDDDFPRE